MTRTLGYENDTCAFTMYFPYIYNEGGLSGMCSHTRCEDKVDISTMMTWLGDPYTMLICTPSLQCEDILFAC